MFTGIIEELGKIQKITNNNITVECVTVLQETKLGDSIAVNGVCLTVTKIFSNGFVADISPETFRVTALRNLHAGDFVNLERAMKANGRFGGHIVSGHIDGIAEFVKSNPKGEFIELTFKLDETQKKYVVSKGSIAINGISLTIAGINEREIITAIIPHTLENTNLKHLKSGSIVNIEVDILAKYVEKFLSTGDNRESKINLEFLQEHGF